VEIAKSNEIQAGLLEREGNFGVLFLFIWKCGD
jgi:hypothetical protein